MGRPAKLTPEVQKAICDAVSAGNTRRAAAEYAGVGVTTFQRWMAQGRAAKRGEFREFWEAIKKAEAVAEVRNVGVIAKAAQKTWQAAAWWLERKRPKHWAITKTKHEHSGPNGGAISLAFSIEDVRAADEELEAWERERRGENGKPAG